MRRAARRRVGGHQLAERAEAADLPAATEAPGRGAEPADVLGRVAGVGQLPVEDATQPVRPDQEVAATGSRRAPSPPARPAGVRPASQRTPSSSAGRTSPSASRRGSGSPSGSDGGSPSMAAGSMRWMPASAVPAWSVRARRAAAQASSRRILRGIVSPSRRSTTSQLAPSSSPSPTATTPGTGTSAVAAARSRSSSIRTRPLRRGRGPSAG